MGDKSTLHSAVLKDDSSTPSPAYDLKSWQGLTHVLKVGKESLTDATQYGSFRNLVLQYAQQGGDPELKKKIDALLLSFEEKKQKAAVVTPLEEVKEETQNDEATSGDVPEASPEASQLPIAESATADSPKSVFGARRAQPVFDKKAPHEEKRSLHVIKTPTPAFKKKTEDTESAPAVTAVETPVVVTPPPVPVVEEPQHSEEKSAPKTLEDHKLRIAEIKRAVNDHIGNPVALMGAHSTSGKKYMAALLTALKASSAGGDGNVDGAMADLENAFRALMEEEGAHEAKEVPPEKKTDDEVSPSLPETKSTEVMEDVLPDESEVPQDTEAVQPHAPELDGKDFLPHIIMGEDEDRDKKGEASPIEKEDDAPAEVEEAPQEPVASDEEDTEEHDHDTEDGETDREPLQSAFAKTDDTISQIVGSVHKQKGTDEELFSAVLPVTGQSGYETLPEVPKEFLPDIPEKDQDDDEDIIRHNKWTKKELEVTRAGKNFRGDPIDAMPVKQSELVSPQINAMLVKLLDEWSVFSGGGIFGIGPSGIEHPLYIRLAPLSMGEVLAGRWEGAKPKILKNIKQYVDAWRHEQGITYTDSETFEHYLRRVVDRILKRQNH